ncbi:MAG: DUF86 domain-containing protein [Deltaproteobacteria bacterium]|nr:DUF86 domain-containing protein [Deltaproteobacteria bacterium]
MPHYDLHYRLRHMLDNAEEAISLIKGKSRTSLKHERMLELALIRLVEVIGEAAAKIRDEDYEKYPTIPLTQVVGMRNRLIHGYDQLDIDILWDTIEVDLPLLVKELKKILGE